MSPQTEKEMSKIRHQFLNLIYIKVLPAVLQKICMQFTDSKSKLIQRIMDYATAVKLSNAFMQVPKEMGCRRQFHLNLRYCMRHIIKFCQFAKRAQITLNNL